MKTTLAGIDKTPMDMRLRDILKDLVERIESLENGTR